MSSTDIQQIRQRLLAPYRGYESFTDRKQMLVWLGKRDGDDPTQLAATLTRFPAPLIDLLNRPEVRSCPLWIALVR